MKAINFPSWWHGADIDAKADWLLHAGHVRSIGAAYSFLSKLRRPKRQVIPPPARLSRQEFEDYMAKRHLD